MMSIWKLVANPVQMARREEASNEKVMTDFLPYTSDRDPAIIRLIAKAIVVDDWLRLEVAGDIANSLAMSGSRG